MLESRIDDLLRVIAREAAQEVLAAQPHPSPWLDVKGAAEYLLTTQKGVRDAVAKNGLPVHRTPTGRLRFRRDELDRWVMGEAA